MYSPDAVEKSHILDVVEVYGDWGWGLGDRSGGLGAHGRSTWTGPRRRGVRPSKRGLGT